MSDERDAIEQRMEDFADSDGTEHEPEEFDPASLGPRTKGKTCIGCVVKGVKDGQERTMYLYQIKDHQDCYREVQSQGISYTTGVPAMIGAKLILEETWRRAGVWNIEQLDPDPFMEGLKGYGLPWRVVELTDFSLDD
mgnify:CR=1 FL=1